MNLKYLSFLWLLWAFFGSNVWAGATQVTEAKPFSSYVYALPTANEVKRLPETPSLPRKSDNNDNGNALFGMWASFVLAILFSFPFLLLFLIDWITVFMWMALGLFILSWVIGLVLMRFVLVNARDAQRDAGKRLSAKIGLVVALLLAFVNIFAVLLH